MSHTVCHEAVKATSGMGFHSLWLKFQCSFCSTRSTFNFGFYVNVETNAGRPGLVWHDTRQTLSESITFSTSHSGGWKRESIKFSFDVGLVLKRCDDLLQERSTKNEVWEGFPYLTHFHFLFDNKYKFFTGKSHCAKLSPFFSVWDPLSSCLVVVDSSQRTMCGISYQFNSHNFYICNKKCQLKGSPLF
jgi:hypothetical protein